MPLDRLGSRRSQPQVHHNLRSLPSVRNAKVSCHNSFQIANSQSIVGTALTSLPPAIHRVIFQSLNDDPLTSVCLGLTCNAFYQIHRSIHPDPIPLTQGLTYNGGRQDAFLKSLLWSWIPANLPYNWETGRYAKPEVIVAQGERYKRILEEEKQAYKASLGSIV